MKSNLKFAIGDFVREAHVTCSGVHDFILNSELYAPAESKILSCLSVIFGDYPAELFSMPDRSLRFGFEVGIEDVVLNSSALMRTKMMVMLQPGFVEVVELPETETEEVIQAGFLDRTDKAFTQCNHSGSAWRSFGRPHSRT
jgi:hypothetical protein